MKQFICNFVNAVGECDQKQGKSISPVGSRGKAKLLKMRWALPGRGKSGGLRLLLAAYCADRWISIVGAWKRDTDPDDEDIDEAAKQLKSMR